MKLEMSKGVAQRIALKKIKKMPISSLITVLCISRPLISRRLIIKSIVHRRHYHNERIASSPSTTFKRPILTHTQIVLMITVLKIRPDSPHD